VFLISNFLPDKTNEPLDFVDRGVDEVLLVYILIFENDSHLLGRVLSYFWFLWNVCSRRFFDLCFEFWSWGLMRLRLCFEVRWRNKVLDHFTHWKLYFELVCRYLLDWLIIALGINLFDRRRLLKWLTVIFQISQKYFGTYLLRNYFLMFFWGHWIVPILLIFSKKKLLCQLNIFLNSFRYHEFHQFE
jgi:hypothetical protein